MIDWVESIPTLRSCGNSGLRPLVFSVLVAAAVGVAQDYSAWAYSKDLYYDTSPDGANTVSDVEKFPVLVRLTEADFPFAQARDSGQDLRFSKQDGTPIPFEIDRYDPVAKRAEIWVRAESLKGNTKGHLARLYWGNPAAAMASAPGAVFERNNGFVAAWHLRGQYPTPRANSVLGGENAVPVNYDNDEQAAGLIGYADSLDGEANGDHLQTWERLDSLSGGFTFSIWAYPTAVADWARFMDFGNGNGLDNLVLSRFANTNDIVFDVYNNTSKSSLIVANAIALNQWQFYAVTVQGAKAKLYRNGVPMDSTTLSVTIPDVRRGFNYLGKSNWSTDTYFKGKLDEPVVSRTARSADWIKLAHANQRADQTLVTFSAPVTCVMRFGGSADTSVAEGAEVRVSGFADCATRYSWSVLSGPAPRILDPDVKDLGFLVPRVARDTSIRLEFRAEFSDSIRTRVVRIDIKESIPDPVFTLPADLTWNGKDSLLIRPVIANLAAIKASSQPRITFAWTLKDAVSDTAWREDGLLLKSAGEPGVMSVGLCLHNNGPQVCREMAVTLDIPVGLARKSFARGHLRSGPSFRSHDANGRRLSAGHGLPRP